MKISLVKESWKPSLEELQVLKICLVGEERIEEEVDRWEKTHPLVGLSSPTRRLLPYLYSRLSKLGISLTNEKILKGVYIHNWAADQMFINQGMAWLLSSNLEREKFLLIKGVALKHSLYSENPSNRPCSDIDLLIHPRDIGYFSNSLESQNFKWKGPYPPWFAFKYKKSFSYVLDQIDIDLNQDIYEFGLTPNLMVEIFSRRVPLTIDGIRFWTMSPTDMLLHTLLHGFSWNLEPTSRWILDAALLIEKEEIDWNLFLEVVTANSYQVPVLEQLKFLVRELWSQIPDYVIDGLAKKAFGVKPILVALHLRESSRTARRLQRILYMDLFSSQSFSRHDASSEISILVVWRDNLKMILQSLRPHSKTIRPTN